MASFGNFNAAVISPRAEATNALVNVNLEINLAKIVTPPTEYHAIGQNMTQARLHEAQEGSRHILARKLGLLFRTMVTLPSTPKLIKAYGERASEIAMTSSANTRGLRSHGLFSEVTGADTTTLWAAATSGKSAIQCHLLACMLARIWDSAEATSIWVEIIQRRKSELQIQLAEDGELDPDVLVAVGSEFMRSDIREWDASTRAWLRVADEAMTKRQTQLRLIVDNMNIAVNMKPDTYESVMDAWSSAMNQMERLLMGVPLQVHSGDILLGLLSWHLYPDMQHLASNPPEISQEDPLLKGRGILTLGLDPSPRMSKDCRSVYWALPLAYLRYYGRLPVTCMRSIRMSDQDRLTLDEILWAVLSAFVAQWDDGSVSTAQVLQYVSDVAIELHWACGYENKSESPLKSLDGNQWVSSQHGSTQQSWLTTLSRIMLLFKDRLDEPRIRKLRNMGCNYYPTAFIPFLGIFNVETFLVSAKSLEDKIELLRNAALHMAKDSSTTHGYDYFIVYKKAYLVQGKLIYGYELASAIPEHDVSEIGDVNQISSRRYRRWLLNIPTRFLAERIRELEAEGEIADYMASSNIKLRKLMTTSPGTGRDITNSRDMGAHRIIVHSSAKDKDKDKASITPLELGFGSTTRTYQVIFGKTHSIALVQQDGLFWKNRVKIHQKNTPVQGAEPPKYELKAGDIMRLFQPGKFKFGECAKMLNEKAKAHDELLALIHIESLYKTMRDAKLDVRVVQLGFANAQWVHSVRKRLSEGEVISTNLARARSRKDIGRHSEITPGLKIQTLTITECFACIAMMETGVYNLNPEDLTNVFAISSADSLYIASAVLEDPAKDTASRPIRRLTGNIGKAGVVFLVPPKEPEIKSYNTIDEWYCYDHKEFDGMIDDCFEGTTLHLSFSEACQPINVDFSGSRDIEGYFLETLVSVYDRETWIAEVDILRSLRSTNIIRTYLQSAQPCNCRPSHSKGSLIISIDNYAEIIVPPKQPGILRAKGNWQARLVALAICSTKGYRVVLKPEQTCWNCFCKLDINDHLAKSGENGPKAIIII